MRIRLSNHWTDRERFLLRVVPKPGDECWEWIGSHDGKGYGRIGGSGLAHRFMFNLFTGESPEVVMHACDNPGCVNPEHLQGGTVADNQADMAAKGRSGWRKRTECGKGHPFDDDNTLWETKRANGKVYPVRLCKICRREGSRRR